MRGPIQTMLDCSCSQELVHWTSSNQEFTSNQESQRGAELGGQGDGTNQTTPLHVAPGIFQSNRPCLCLGRFKRSPVLPPLPGQRTGSCGINCPKPRQRDGIGATCAIGRREDVWLHAATQARSLLQHGFFEDQHLKMKIHTYLDHEKGVPCLEIPQWCSPLDTPTGWSWHPPQRG